ncbi:MAG: hypothetical protein QM820_53365 [Minicystis sp.]
MKAPRTTAFEVLDALGLARLDKRSGDLDGAVPLRVAQACVPLLEGNAFGFQINLTRAIEIRRGLGRVTVDIAAPHRDALAAAHRAAVPRLLAQGLVARAFQPALADGFVKVERAGLGKARVRLWTGLCVRADAGVWLRVSSTANRRNRFFEVDEHFIIDDGAFVPLILDVTLRSDAPDRVRLEGEIATIAPVAPNASIDVVPLAEAPEVGKAHAAFYDAAYFAAKKGEPTRKYRKMKPPPDDSDPAHPARCRLVTAGPAAHTIITTSPLVGGAGPLAKPPSSATIPRIVFANQVPFEARYDGHTLTVDPDRRALEAGARAVEQTFTAALGPTFIEENRGAMWYLTKYFTPHPPGEPHFFVKPWAFVQTPPGWSCLLEGVHGDGFGILRGVVSTDVFHATPAVFHVYRAGDPIRVAAGEPLVHVLPIPRRLLHAGFREAAFRDLVQS